jgi:putative ABC transport system permease protein
MRWRRRKALPRPWLWLVRLIGVIVPRRLRADWRQEWEAELQYRETLLSQWDKLDWRVKLALLWHSLGAFADALWLQPRRLEDEMFQDLRFGVRMLLKNKMFTAIAALSLMLGIGANTAIFSLINTLMLRPLPVKAPQELALFSIIESRGPGLGFNYPFYEMIRDNNQSFTGVIAGSDVGDGRLIVNEGGGAVELVQQQLVSGNFFSVLGVSAAVGRALTEADDNPASAQPGAVISYEFWQRRFGLDPAVVGRQVTVNDTALIIVGVAPPGFFGFDVGYRPDIWWPIKVANDETTRQLLSQNTTWWVRIFGRLRPGVSMARAQAEVDLIFRRQQDEIAGESSAGPTPTERREHFEQRIALESGSAGSTWLRRQFRQPLLILMITVALTLLIACVNIANLLLSRAATRRKEIAVRLAVGAGRFRLIRQLLTESVLLAALGGGGGLLFAQVCGRAMLTYLPRENRAALDLSLDARVLGFTLAVSVLTGLLFGMAPAWQATRLDLTASLKDQTGASAGRSRLMLNKLLVVTQVALSLFLLVGAGLFARSLRNLRTLDAGINYENIVHFRIDTGSGYNPARLLDLHKQALSRLEALPGARSATMSIATPLTGSYLLSRVAVPGYSSGPDENMTCNILVVGPRFFETMKIPLLAGRDFGPLDERAAQLEQDGAASTNTPDSAEDTQPSAPFSAVINQAMAHYFFGNENPIGKRFSWEGRPAEIIGVVRDAKFTNLREQPPRTFYLYYFQTPIPFNLTIQLRTVGDPAPYAATIQRLVREIDPQLQVVGLQTMSEAVNETLVQERFVAQVAGAFSLFALLLACIGLYGVMSYAVTRRTNEIGVRMALGAQGKDVVWLVMREVMLLVAVGACIGLAAAMATTRLVSTLLFGLEPNDPTTIAMATLLMIGVAALAGYLPARRAAQVDPMIALRHE